MTKKANIQISFSGSLLPVKKQKKIIIKWGKRGQKLESNKWGDISVDFPFWR